MINFPIYSAKFKLLPITHHTSHIKQKYYPIQQKSTTTKTDYKYKVLQIPIVFVLISDCLFKLLSSYIRRKHVSKLINIFFWKCACFSHSSSCSTLFQFTLLPTIALLYTFLQYRFLSMMEHSINLILKLKKSNGIISCLLNC